MADNPNKRKQGQSGAPGAKRPRFQAHFKNTISTTPSSKAYPNDEVNVACFVRAHENEIRALEAGIENAKKRLMRRAFQDVPRDMRRRTASHNPRRVPGRLRTRATREMNEDNTPKMRGKSGSGIGKGTTAWLRKEGMKKAKRKPRKRGSDKEEDGKITITETISGDAMEGVETAKVSHMAATKRKRRPSLAKAALVPARFRKRQINKCWLPTHMFHTKRAHMTPPNEPLWRFAIPITPTLKSYRLTHRAATLRGATAWDMSYISTIGLHGTEGSIVGMLRALHFCSGVDEESWEDSRKAKKWKNGTRTWEGWLYEREGKLPKKIAPVTVIWSAQGPNDKAKRKVFIRVHPSAFLHLWNEVLKVSKVQKPNVAVEDLRFEIGSIEITGPGATETLCSALTPIPASEGHSDASERPEAVWKALAPVTNLGVLPHDVLLGFNVTDPRLHYPPRTVEVSQDASSQSQLMQTLAYWPVDDSQTSPSIFNRDVRLAAGRSLPSQQSINRRKGAASPGEYPEPRSGDPVIPVLAFVSRSSNSWTVLLPWKCVDPVWRHMMFYPISTGGNPKYGGLTERRQIYFERSAPWYPGDFPGTAAGWTWELQQRIEREKEWLKRPKGKRIEWGSIDLGKDRKGEVGNPWDCDWERLLQKGPAVADDQNPLDSSAPFRHLPSPTVLSLLSHPDPSTLSQYISIPHLFTVKITMVQRGHPTDCARIYRLPTTDSQLRKKWLSLMPHSESTGKGPIKQRWKQDNRKLPLHLQRRALAASLLDPHKQDDGALKAGHPDYPAVPDEEDLIGFVTTGNYNLAEGRMTAVANMHLKSVVEDGKKSPPGERRICIVRNAGQSLGRLANMSEDRAADGQGDFVKSPIKLSGAQLEELTHDILEDTVYNIIHDIAKSCHRSEKLLRMQSAATEAETLALQSMEVPSQKGATSQSAPTATTDAAVYDNGRVFLKGNPLKTTPNITCPHCKQPRLMHPIMGKGMQEPDIKNVYCNLYPWVQRPGHDIYGNPFPTDMAKSKKERELVKKAEKNNAGTPNSQDADVIAGEGNGPQNRKTTGISTGGKPASYIPWHTCPNCKRSLLITRFAKHLEQCLGISGRQSSRNARAKLIGQNGTGSGMSNTPLGSRLGTPVPGSQSFGTKEKRSSPTKKLGAEDDDVDDNETPEKKKKKKSSYIKKADRERMAKEGVGPLKVKLKSKDSSKEGDSAQRKSENGEGKRDREDGGDEVPRKKIKLTLGKENDAANKDSRSSSNTAGGSVAGDGKGESK
ncbi:ribonuclease P complex subunit Pop1 [Delitschia confertaspora ATCC 74209]|uniref:SAGA-associated factor 11 n=1 Tax=Delitschia confertaspora ATCC 74209 TaxID=1513339 RepID=A0A9P4JHS2_9PLEO|nr:ribonuclease P complex subunit Pop1 [Delitschia confertaspora ATCC 74209]